MDSYPGDFPFGIMDVVELLHLRIRRRQANSVYVDCPFCGDRRGKMNVNFVKNVWRCNYCDEHGGMLALYARLWKCADLNVFTTIIGSKHLECRRQNTASEQDAKKQAKWCSDQEQVQSLPVDQTLDLLGSSPHRP